MLYSEVKANDIVEYYAGIDKLLEDGDINKIVSSLRISQKSITIRSASEWSCFILPKAKIFFINIPSVHTRLSRT